MNKKEPLSEELGRAVEMFFPYISVDCIILGFDSGCIKVLLCRLKSNEEWLLTGGFVKREEGPDDSAFRILQEKTGLKGEGFLKQFHFFNKQCDLGDDENIMMLNRLNVEAEPVNMKHLNRFVGLAYYILVKYQDVSLVSADYEDVAWFDINNLPPVIGRHRELLDKVMSDIRREIGFTPFGYELLPDKFTMPELRSVYEAILGRALDRRNFQRKLLATGYIEALDEVRKIGAHKSPNLYAFIRDKYEKAKKRRSTDNE